MKSKGVLLLAAGLIIVAGLFFFGDTIPPKKEMPEMPPMMGDAGSSSTVDFNAILVRARGTLRSTQLDSISTIELQLKKTRGDKEQQSMLQTLANTWEKSGNILVAGKYYADAAELNNDKALYEKAGELLYTGFPTTTDSLARIFGAQQGVRVFQALGKIDSANLEYPIHEAVCYIDGLGNVMQGVTILKSVETKDPENKEMNLILGRLAVVSGQYDKAIARLEKLTKTDPGNAEAYYHLGEAYRAVGRTDDAIKSLEQCKKLVNDPAFAAQIDEYIIQIKKP
ncbi:MAG: tetratricopeptide repeat protein [Bacteroidetes bacterium]|nr:tetratricopeptide repeat protein [Bacteroidota bacterium]